MSRKTLFDEVELYDLEEISALTGASVPTLRRYIRDGKLRAQKFGTKYRATKEHVQAFLQGDAPAASQAGAAFSGGGAAATRETTPSSLRHPAEPGRSGTVETEVDRPPTPVAPATPAAAVERGERGPTWPEPTQPSAGPGQDAVPQLLFMKPEDVDTLVASLATHMDRIERQARQRDDQVAALVEELRDENRRLRRAVDDARDDSKKASRELCEQITGTILDPRREEQDRIRFTWLRGRMDEIAEHMEELRTSPSTVKERAPWWCFWRRQ